MIRFISESRNRDCWRSIARVAIAVMLAVHFSTPCDAQQLAATERAQIDRDAHAVLAATGAPSASIAIVRGGEVVYERAYGDGRIDPKTPATPSMRYAIGSVSKQFTATALQMQCNCSFLFVVAVIWGDDQAKRVDAVDGKVD